MTDLIRRIDAMQVTQVGTPDEWSKATKSGYNQAATDIAMNILKLPAAPVTVQVKPLTWDDRGYEWSWWADTVFGRGSYQIRCEGGIGYLVDFDGVTIGDPHDPLEAAKAAAQADYAARILAAIDVQPAPDVAQIRAELYGMRNALQAIADLNSISAIEFARKYPELDKALGKDIEMWGEVLSDFASDVLKDAAQ